MQDSLNSRLAELAAAATGLEAVFGNEWTDLDDSVLFSVALDFCDANCSATEYARRIGLGNLQSYAATLSANRS